MSLFFAQNVDSKIISPFIMEINVAAGQLNFVLPCLNNAAYSYDYIINYGDGTGDFHVTTYNGGSHSYSTTGVYTVTITGTCETIYFYTSSEPSSRVKPLRVLSLGSLHFKSINFGQCVNLTSFTSGADVTFESGIDLINFFAISSVITDIDFTGSTIQPSSTKNMFFSCHLLTNLILPTFNCDICTDMSNMFYDCRILQTVDVTGLDTSNVLYLTSMFAYCYDLTSVDVSGFDFSSTDSLNSFFYDCNSITDNALDWWNTQTQITTNLNCFYNNTSRPNYASIPNDWKGL